MERKQEVYTDLENKKEVKFGLARVEQFMNDNHQWQNEVLGGGTAVSALRHLANEAQEAYEGIEEGEPISDIQTELADCLIMLLHATKRMNMTFAGLLRKAEEKMVINRDRKWGKPDEHGVVNHIREEQEEPCDHPFDWIQHRGEGYYFCAKCRTHIEF